METLLLTISETLDVAEPDGMVHIPVQDGQEFRGGFVTLRYPDGSSELAMACMTTHIFLPNAMDSAGTATYKPRHSFGLSGVQRAQLPVGTEVWLIENQIEHIR